MQRPGEGRGLLTELRDWWLSSANDLGPPRPDSTKPTPEAVRLADGFKLAREREPGDGRLQLWVVDKINEVLTG